MFSQTSIKLGVVVGTYLSVRFGFFSRGRFHEDGWSLTAMLAHLFGLRRIGHQKPPVEFFFYFIILNLNFFICVSLGREIAIIRKTRIRFQMSNRRKVVLTKRKLRKAPWSNLSLDEWSEGREIIWRASNNGHRTKSVAVNKKRPRSGRWTA